MFTFCSYFRLEFVEFCNLYKGCFLHTNPDDFIVRCRQSYNKQQKFIEVHTDIRLILKPDLGVRVGTHFYKDLYKRFHHVGSFKLTGGHHNIIQRYKLDRVWRIMEEMELPLSGLENEFGFTKYIPLYTILQNIKK